MIRIDRLLFYTLPLCIGIYFNFTSWDYTLYTFIYYITILQSMMILNDITDSDIDTMNQCIRATYKEYLPFIYFCLLSLSYLIYLNYIYQILNIETTILYFIYSVLGIAYHQEPIRLKKYFPFNNISLAIIAVLAYCIGINNLSFYTTISFSIPTYYNKYLEYAYFLFIFFFIVSIYKDFKDIKGDNYYGITTLPILWKKYKINLSLFKVLALLQLFLIIMVYGFILFNSFENLMNYNFHNKYLLNIFYLFLPIHFYTLMKLYKYQYKEKKETYFYYSLLNGLLLTIVFNKYFENYNNIF